MHSRLDHIDDWAKLAGTANYKVGALARVCGVSVRQLFRFFEEKHNRSPHEWLHELRMRRASELLCDKSTAKEVAIKLNYKELHQNTL